MITSYPMPAPIWWVEDARWAVELPTLWPADQAGWNGAPSRRLTWSSMQAAWSVSNSQVTVKMQHADAQDATGKLWRARVVVGFQYAAVQADVSWLMSTAHENPFGGPPLPTSHFTMHGCVAQVIRAEMPDTFETFMQRVQAAILAAADQAEAVWGRTQT